MKKYLKLSLLTVFISGLVNQPAVAQAADANNRVNLVVTGNILPRTCSIENSGDRLLQMKDIYLDALKDNTEADGVNTTDIIIKCPQTQTTRFKVVDNTQQVNSKNQEEKSGHNYLYNMKTQTASGVGIKLYMGCGANSGNAVKIGDSADKLNLVTNGSGNDHLNDRTDNCRTVKLRGVYFKLPNLNPTPGTVRGEATIEFQYN